MYWNNPIIEVTYPNDRDPIKESFHSGRHCLFWNPKFEKDSLPARVKMIHLCDWANQSLQKQGVEGFFSSPGNHYNIANIVKLNLWVNDIRQQGVVKPVLAYYHEEGYLGLNNGESRFMALERIPHITHLSGFVSTHIKFAHLFTELEPVICFEQFAQLCKAAPGQQFLFTLTDPTADYGIYWYEYNSELTRRVTPNQTACINALRKYLENAHNHYFLPDWFDCPISWDLSG
jgi:hypothetical protein